MDMAALLLRAEPLSRHFGAHILGDGLADALRNPDSQPVELWEALAKLLTEHSLLLLRPGVGLRPAAEVAIKDHMLKAMGVAAQVVQDDEADTVAEQRPEDTGTEDGSENTAGESERENHGKGGGLFAKYSKPGVQNLRGARVPGHPSLSLLGHGPVEDHHGLSGEMQQSPLGTGCHVNWHSDGAFHRYDQLPSRLLQFYCVRTPLLPAGETLVWRRGDGDEVHYQPGATFFGSWSRALELATAPMQKRAAQLVARYTGFGKTQTQADGHPPYPDWSQTGCRPTAPPSEDPDADPVNGTPINERLLHPLTMHHPVSSKPMLFFQTVCLEALFELESGVRLSWEESMDTLERLWLPSIHSSEIYVHNWQPGDLVLVDNIALFHGVSPFGEWAADPPQRAMRDVRRLLHRAGGGDSCSVGAWNPASEMDRACPVLGVRPGRGPRL